ncbi:DUF1802 family protein [Sphaerospermopsis torques-reginae]|uniref:DUF1802 family protein n=1 Tax=Sphaerospermopsis torques-reginae ITEP-024 TaxID=984208 RepID=A0ABX8X4K6_9CYAN|nr:DUF1802 family protein [Sphaerospermopsis torques-reginae]QYX33442.1 DUF1802 family protein [Sphaerospermopsis torques-reginae ITEP-024]
MSIQIINGIQLPAFDVEMLGLGKLFLVPFKQFLHQGKSFWLYPSVTIPNNLTLQEYYQPQYVEKAKTSVSKYSTYPVNIKFWGRCEYYWRINPDQQDILPKIAQSTIWNLSALEKIFEQHRVLKLAILRVYHLSKPCIINIPVDSGSFYWTKTEDLINNASENDICVISDDSFTKRKNIILSGESYLYTNIENLQWQCENLLENNPNFDTLNHEIKQFLGWNNQPVKNTLDPDLYWIKNIANVGNSSDGNEFEKLVRKSLIKLGFSSSNTNTKANLDSDKLGGAGGLDFYCEYPYPVIGECKATKTEKVVDSTVAQLVKLGLKHLQEEYNSCIKIIMAAGKLATDTEKTAQGNKMNVIRPETLQKLVTLKAKHPGSIDLLNLKQDLEKKPFGEEADDKINKYIEKVEQEIKLRSHIIQLVKNYLQNAGIESTGVDTLHGAYFGSHPPQPLKPEEMHEILIELSSPLTGYLGREKGNDWKNDKFYYLRDLAI